MASVRSGHVCCMSDTALKDLAETSLPRSYRGIGPIGFELVCNHVASNVLMW